MGVGKRKRNKQTNKKRVGKRKRNKKQTNVSAINLEKKKCVLAINLRNRKKHVSGIKLKERNPCRQ